MPRRRRENPKLLNDTEIDVLRSLWNGGTISAARVQSMLLDEGLEVVFATVKMTLDRLVRIGAVTRKEVKGTYHYTPVWKPADVANSWLSYLKEKIYSNKRIS
jgi:predicted transcriptional regulator